MALPKGDPMRIVRVFVLPDSASLPQDSGHFDIRQYIEMTRNQSPHCASSGPFELTPILGLMWTLLAFNIGDWGFSIRQANASARRLVEATRYCRDLTTSE